MVRLGNEGGKLVMDEGDIVKQPEYRCRLPNFSLLRKLLKYFPKKIALLNVLLKAVQENCSSKTVQKLSSRSSAV